MPEDGLVDETTEELEFLEIDELFDAEDEELCSNCNWKSYTSEDGKVRECSLIKMINKLAVKKGVAPLNDSFGCNRWTEVKQEGEV